jgi:DNA-binding PadR family transcriptional regulator
MDELIEKTRGPRARIIEGLSFYDGRAHSQRLRHYGDIPSSTYHFDKLEDQGIIERDGTEYVSKGGEAIVYQLTDFGYDVADELEAPPDADAEMAEVKEAVRLLDKKVQALEQLDRRVDALGEIVGELDDRLTNYEGRNPNEEYDL